MILEDWAFTALLLVACGVLLSPVLWLALLMVGPCCRLTGTAGFDCDYWSRRGGLC